MIANDSQWFDYPLSPLIKTDFFIIFSFFSLDKMYTRYRHAQPGVAERSDADDWLLKAVNIRFQSAFIENWKNLTKKRSLVSFGIQMVHKMHAKYRQAQPGVAERSDADDWLLKVMDVGFQSALTENWKNLTKKRSSTFFEIRVVQRLYIR